MEGTKDSPQLVELWQAVGASVQGAAHARTGRPCEDALAWNVEAVALPSSEIPGWIAVLAAADGHGSAACFRSGKGAELAVQVAVAYVSRCLTAALLNEYALPYWKRLAQERWPDEIVRLWRAAVQTHWQTHPPREEEQNAAQRKQGGEGIAGWHESDVWRAYGTTLLCAGITPLFAVYLQIGDGDLLVVRESGDVVRAVAPDPRCLGVETTSLSQANAAAQFRVTFQPLVGHAPRLIVLSSDGYANSFADETAFLQAASDLRTLLQTEGAHAVQTRLPDWLRETSEAGSGDDVTVGMLSRTN